MLINQLQLDAADERRAHGASPRVEALLKEQAEEQEKLERHLEDFEYTPRRALNERVDKAQALRRYNLREGGGDYEAASMDLPALSCDDSGDEQTDDDGDDAMDGGGGGGVQGTAADQGAAAAATASRAKAKAVARAAKAATKEAVLTRRFVPFNTVRGIRIIHVDDKSAKEIPDAIDGVVGDSRPSATVHINGQHCAVTHIQTNYLSWGAGSKKADNIIDEIIANVAEVVQGEMVLVFVFDRCSLGLCAKVATQLGMALKDRGICSVFEAYYFPSKHGRAPPMLPYLSPLTPPPPPSPPRLTSR